MLFICAPGQFSVRYSLPESRATNLFTGSPFTARDTRPRRPALKANCHSRALPPSFSELPTPMKRLIAERGFTENESNYSVHREFTEVGCFRSPETQESGRGS